MSGFCHIVRQINVTMVLLHLKERRDGLKEIHQHMLPSDTLFWIKDYWTIFHTILISGKCLFYLYNTFCCITSINLPILFYLLHSHYRSTAEWELSKIWSSCMLPNGIPTLHLFTNVEIYWLHWTIIATLTVQWLQTKMGLAGKIFTN